MSVNFRRDPFRPLESYFIVEQIFGSRLSQRYLAQITVRPNLIFPLPENVIIENGLNLLKQKIIENVERERPSWNENRIRNSVRGTFIMRDLSNNMVFFYPPPFSLDDLTPLLVYDLLERWQQSNSVTDYNQLELGYNISPSLNNVGNSAPPEVPKYIVKKKHRSWVQHYHQNVAINCAAYVLSLLILGEDAPEMAVESHAYNIMVQNLWFRDVSLGEVLNYYIDKYPSHRLSMLPTSSRAFSSTTLAGKDFVYSETDKSNQKYIIYEPRYKHYGLFDGVATTFRKIKNCSVLKFCDKCLEIATSQSCSCSSVTCKKYGKKCVSPAKKQKTKEACSICLKYGGCKCAKTTCTRCLIEHRDGYNHRCVLKAIYTDTKFYTDVSQPQDGKLSMVWVYDIESLIYSTETKTKKFVTDDEGFLTGGYTDVFRNQHEANLLIAKNIFTGENKIFKGQGCLQEFLMFLASSNKSNHICFAHNASGYDTRLVFEQLIGSFSQKGVEMITRGTKFLQLSAKNGYKTIQFRDSLLFLPGSLKSLAKSFDLSVGKGEFPHLFNTLENQNYVGEIPSKHYFDLVWTKRNNSDIEEFNEWYNMQAGKIWSFQEEIIKYCQTDVDILAEIVLKFHDICMSKFDTSPLAYVTGPSFVHNVIMKDVTKNYPTNTENDNYFTELATKETWAALKTCEHMMAKKALRGGRTDVRCVYKKLTPDEIARGCKIVYQDVVSLYPYVQLKFEYPVGTPKIQIYDSTYLICQNSAHRLLLNCDCSPIDKGHNLFRSQVNVKDCTNQRPTLEYLKSFFGFIVCDVQPPSNLYHPVLVIFDEKNKKCIAPLTKITHGCFTSVEIQKAMEMGYVVEHVYRIDEYHKKSGLWNDFMKNLYIEKMATSGKTPSTEEQERLINAYETRFGMGQMVKDCFPRCKKDPALRMVYKIMLNCGWGKHCESNHKDVKIYDSGANYNEMFNFYQNVSSGLLDFKSVHPLSHSQLITYSDPNSVRDLLSKVYAPAGVFVPSYGRLVLLEQLEKLGERALYHDTDSIIYFYDPEKYNIPVGDILGDWEEEDISKQGIAEFVAIGPKSYGLKTFTNETIVKVKGVSCKRAHSKILNFEVMVNLIKEHLQNRYPILNIPQMNFNYGYGQGIVTTYSNKQISFQPENLKGDIAPNLLVYPKGYCEQCKVNKNHCSS